MGLTDDYLKAIGTPTSGGSSDGLTNAYLKAKQKRKKDEEDGFVETTSVGYTSNDIAPVAEQEDKGGLQFFQKGAFEDGYQSGDVAKAILGTVGDVVVDLGKGFFRSAEGIADLLSYGVAGISDAVGADDFADTMRLGGKTNVTDMLFGGADEYLDNYSVLGRTTDSAVEGVGQIGFMIATSGLGAASGLGKVGSMLLSSGIIGASGMGSGMSEAYEGGATDEEAVTYGVISGASEAITEMIFGGLGKTAKAAGVGIGLSSADDMLAKKVSGLFTSRIAKNFAEYGIKAGAEGFEEVLAGVAQAVGKKVTYMSEEELGDILRDENLLEQFVVGSITSGIAQSGDFIKANKTGTDFITGMNANEQSVVDKVYEDRIAEAEKNGTLTNKEKSKIYESVLNDMEKGYISTDTIESVLGGETYKTYQDTIDSEDALQKEFDTLNKMKQGEMTGEQIDRRAELKQQLEELKNNSQRDQLKQQLSDEVFGVVKDSRLANSYAERARRGQAFEADLTKYDEKQRAVVQKAVESGILNNTNRTHEFVDMVAKISADKGVLFDFTNNEKLKESGFAIDGKSVNGYVTKDGITVNMDSAKYVNSVVGHEITHVLEGTELYTELQSAVMAYAKSKGDYQGRYDTLTELYKDIADADIDAELTADLVGDYLFTDSDFINRLSTENRNVFQKIYDEIKYLYKVATAGSKEARELEKVKRAFDKAYKESGKASSDTKYSLSDSDGKQLSKEQQEYFKDSKMRDENGNLKVMYHGSQDAGFHTFDAKMSDDDTSFFFVDRNDVAASYSGTTETYEAKTIRTAEDMNNFLAEIGYDNYKAVEENGKYVLLENNEHIATKDTAQEIYEEFCWYEGVGEGDANYKVYLNLKNPLVIDAKGRPWNKIDAEFSQEVYDRYQSLTAEEKVALVDLAEWEDFRVFNSEIQEAKDNELASAYAKMGDNVNIYDLFSVAADNFSEESMRENARKYLNTREYAQRAHAQGYDGVIFNNIIDNGGYSNGSEGASTVAIAFESNQIKSVANEKPTADADIRFSLSESVEETDKLIAAHNLQSSELLKSIELGGLPMPSIAITKANEVHDQYGDVTLILNKDAIDPKKSRYNKVYGGDAWTPTYPKIEYKPNGAVAKRISDKYYALAKEAGYDAVRPMYRYVNELEDTLNRTRGEKAMLEELYGDTDMMQVYLLDSGKGKVETIQKEVRTSLSDADVEMREFFINELGADVVDGIMAKDGVDVALHKRQYWEQHGEAIENAYSKLLSQEYGFTEEEVKNVLDSTRTYDYLKFVRDAYLYRKNGRETIKTEADRAATEEAIQKAAGKDYKAWVDNLFGGIEEKSGIRNNENYYTNSGNPRSWNALHWENTLENVVKVMRQQTEKGADTFFGGTGIWAVSSKDYNSIEEVKADSHRLRKMSDEEYEAVKESYAQRFNKIAEKIADKSERNYFIAHDNAMEAVVDAVRTYKTKAGILNELKQYRQLNVTEADVDDIVSLVNDIAEMPTGYFEAKPRRAVGFDEVGVFVIPYNADTQLKQELLNRGYAIAEYNPEIEGDRQKVVNQFEEYKFSLSNVGETPKSFGNYNVSGKDLLLEQEIEPVAETETVDENAVPDGFAPITEEEANALREDSFASLDDADMPPEIDMPYDSLADSITIDNKSVKQLSKNISDSLGLNRAGKQELERVLQDFSKDEYGTREKLYAEIERRFGTQYDELRNDEVASAKEYIRNAKISVSPTVKSEFGEAKDYVNFMRSNFGKIRFSKDGLGVDEVYAELTELYPALFSDDVINTADQLRRIAEVANTPVSELIPNRLPEDVLQDATDMIYDSISEYKETERMIATADMQNIANEHLEDFAPIGDVAPDETVSSVNIVGEATAEEARTALESVKTPTAEKKSRRQELHDSIIEGIKSRFEEKGFDFDKVLADAKDLSTLATVGNTPQRVMEKELGYKEGQILSDITVNKVAQNETEGIVWLNKQIDQLRNISKQYGIKPNSKQDAAAQMYAEGFYVAKNGDIVGYGDAELAADFPNADVRNRIKGLAKDTRFRQIYDDTLAMINESRTRNAYPEIPRLDNYFLHFRMMEDTFSRLGLPFNPNDIKAKDLPTDKNGVTADLKPGQPFFASAMHRTGKRTSFALLGGLERYLTSAKNQIYHIDDIQTLRALRNYAADTYGQAKGLEGLDALSEEEVQERIEKVYGAHLSTFAKFLNEEANVLAGKTSLIDRGLEGIIGRRGITFIDTLNKQVGSNMVGFNVSSSLTNFLPVAQTFAKTNKFDFVKAFAQTVSNKIGSIVGKNDGFAENSPVMIRRKGADRFYRTPFQKAGDAGYVLMSAVDDISTELIARTKYNELTRKGMDSQQAHFETDKWVSRLMGDRSLGQQPQIYNSKMLGLFTKFQLEVRNQLDSQFYDTIQEAKVSNEDIQNGLARNAKTAAKVASTFVQLALVQHLFGKAFESVAGYNPAFDIISVLIKAFGFDDDEESEDTVLDNIEQGFLELLEDLPYTSTITGGGRIPISSALPIKELVTGVDQYGNEKSRWETLGEVAPYYVLPTGYGQIKKTKQGLGMFDDDLPIAGSYTDSGNLRFPVDDTLGNRIQAGVFGQWASQNARDYFDNEWAPLKEKQIQEFIDLDLPIKDYREIREDLSEFDKLEDKAEYIGGLDLTTEQKNILINNLTDRKEPINMEDYNEYGGWDEFDFAEKNPEKYQFFKDNGISYSDYASADEDGKRAYTWAFENPEKYTVSKAVCDDFLTFYRYKSDLGDIRADKDENGESISGSAKEKKIEYINNLDLDYGQKIILFRTMYDSKEDKANYNADIVDYLNNRGDISYEEMVTILEELDFTVSADGTVTW